MEVNEYNKRKATVCKTEKIVFGCLTELISIIVQRKVIVWGLPVPSGIGGIVC